MSEHHDTNLTGGNDCPACERYEFKIDNLYRRLDLAVARVEAAEKELAELRSLVGDRRKRTHDECTRDPIFLLQTKLHHLTGEPFDTHRDDEGDIIDDNTGEALSWEELEDRGCAAPFWETQSVWLDRDEAEAFAKATNYRYPDGWRVYCVCAEGNLAELLKRAAAIKKGE